VPPVSFGEKAWHFEHREFVCGGVDSQSEAVAACAFEAPCVAAEALADGECLFIALLGGGNDEGLHQLANRVDERDGM